MPNLKKTPIEVCDIEEYLRECSSFSFELDVLSRISRLGFNTSHGGTYTDPVESKLREFDIRAEKDYDDGSLIFSIECKSLGEHYPLVLQRTPCTLMETGFSFIKNYFGNSSLPVEFLQEKRQKLCHRIEDLYPEVGTHVGRSASQVGRKMQGGDWVIHAEDSDVYAKWTQAINSSIDLLTQNYNKYYSSSGKLYLVVPILVLPDERLWVVDYDAEGTNRCEPRQLSYSPLYLGQKLDIEPPKGMYKFNGFDYEFNFIHICTLSFLEDLVSDVIPGLFHRINEEN